MTATIRPTAAAAIAGPLLLRWLAANLIGFGLVGAFFHNFPLAFAFPPSPTRLGSFSLAPALLGGLLFGAVPALLVGWLQRRVLRPALPLSRWWILTVPAGVGLLHFLGDGFENARDLSYGVVAAGLLMGSLQWLLLRSQNAGSAWWLSASALGWTLGWAIGIILLDAGGMLHAPWEKGLDLRQHGVLGLSVGAAYGVLTGATLAWLLGRRASGVVPGP